MHLLTLNVRADFRHQQMKGKCSETGKGTALGHSNPRPYTLTPNKYQDQAELDHGAAPLLVLPDAGRAVSLLPIRPGEPRLQLRKCRLAGAPVPLRLVYRSRAYSSNQVPSQRGPAFGLKLRLSYWGLMPLLSFCGIVMNTKLIPQSDVFTCNSKAGCNPYRGRLAPSC